MADYNVKGNKTVYCKCGCSHTIPFKHTSCTCPHCGNKFFVKFFGVIIDKNGNYIY